MDPLLQCPSAAHRAVLRLLACANGSRPAHALGEDLRQSAPSAIAEIACTHHVHTVLATAFHGRPELAALLPHDLWVFFAEMQKANLRRNAALLAQLRTIGAAAAHHGIKTVALKGGAELLVPLHPLPGHRYISDLDLLLADHDLPHGRRILEALGGAEADIPEIIARDHHHLPPFLFPDWPAQVELHRAIGAPDIAARLPAGEILGRSMPSDPPGLHVPSRSDRLVHLILHGQLASGRHRRFEVSLRDCLEFQVMSEVLCRDDIEIARGRLGGGAARDAMAGLEALATAIFAPEGWADLPIAARLWSERALLTLGRPAAQRRRDTIDWLLHHGRAALLDPERRRHYLRELTRPGGMQHLAALLRDRRRRIR